MSSVAPRPSVVRRCARLAVAVLLVSPALAGAQTEVTGFGSNLGNLRMFRHVPAGLASAAPLVVALHGCSQSAASYDAETGWQMLAERWRFALLLPQQQNANNSSGCFNWFEPGDTARGQGEALSIKQMVDRMVADHGSAGDRVYVTGLSSGGAMTAVMLATYPDVFAGGAILSGIPYRCATTLTAGFSCMNPGSDLTPAQWGDKVRSATAWSGPWPLVSIWHGDADFTVRPMNLTESMQQWTNVHGIDQTADVADTVAGHAHRVYQDAAGTPLVETYTITGMGHGTPVDPGPGEAQCGTAGAFILDANICSSWHIGRWFGLDDDDGGGGGGSPLTVTFANEDANDGYVKANADGSAAAVGTLESFSGLAIGRGTDAKLNRAVLSFDTAALPDSATVTAATLTVAYRSGSGNPWTNPPGNALVIDAQTGCIGACTIATGDWGAATTASAVAQLAAFAGGSQTSSGFGAAGLVAINRGGRTQLRLRFSANQTATHYLFIDKGASATLSVTYAP